MVISQWPAIAQHINVLCTVAAKFERRSGGPDAVEAHAGIESQACSCARALRSIDLEELNLELERRVRGHHRWEAPGTVRLEIAAQHAIH